jgi:uncharacterized protein YbjT (DUF2867 family)
LVAYGLARQAGIRHVIYFSLFRVKQFRNVPHFAAKVAVESAQRNFGVPFAVSRAAYGFQNERRSKARRTAKKSPWHLPQLKKFSAANPNAVWTIG